MLTLSIAFWEFVYRGESRISRIFLLANNAISRRSQDSFVRSKIERFFRKQISSKETSISLKHCLFLKYSFLERIHKSPTWIFSQLTFSSIIWTALFEKETWKAKPSIKISGFPFVSWAQMSSIHWWDYWIYSNATRNTKEMSFKKICFRKNHSIFGLDTAKRTWIPKLPLRHTLQQLVL